MLHVGGMEARKGGGQKGLHISLINSPQI